MSINYNEIESTHLLFQKGMYFSEIVQKNGYILAYSNIIEDSYWNYATLINSDEAERLSNEVEAFFTNRSKKTAFYLTSYSSYSNLYEQFLLNSGYKKEFVDSWMIFDMNKKKTMDPYLAGKELSIVKVRNLEDMHIFVEVFKKAYGGESAEDVYGTLPEYYYKALLNSFFYKEGNKKVINLIGYLNNAPIVIATYISANNYAGIYNVGTINKYRGKGFGSIMSATAISDAIVAGSKIIFLQTEHGSYVENFYSKLGFVKHFNGGCFVKT